jgi:hypothetical protein
MPRSSAKSSHGWAVDYQPAGLLGLDPVGMRDAARRKRGLTLVDRDLPIAGEQRQLPLE